MPSRSSSFFIQSNSGTNGNFEVVTPRVGGGIAHLWRNNDTPAFPWSGPAIAFGSTGDITSVSLIQSSFGNLEVVVREGDRLFHNFRAGIGAWSSMSGLPGAVAISGAPAFIQSTYGKAGDFEVVAPLAGGGLAHWWRANDRPGMPWAGPLTFGSGAVDAVALLQSSFGNLEVVARVGSQLVHYFRDAAGWHGPFPLTFRLANAAAGTPSWIQGGSGTAGNFELVSPLAGGGLAHWWRANDQPGFPWSEPVTFGGGKPEAVGLVQSSFGNLEVVARTGSLLQHCFRDAQGWHAPVTIADDGPCRPAEGAWSIPFRSGAVAIHMALLRTGKGVVFGFDVDDTMGLSRVVDPATGALYTPPATPMLFCSGHAFLPDGELLVVGGHHGDVRKVHTFDPDARTWTLRATMDHGRWYPTCTALGDGRVLIQSGLYEEGSTDTVKTCQIYDPAAADPARPLGPEQSPPLFGDREIDLYPFAFLLPSGKVAVHSHDTTRFFVPPAAGAGAGSWDAAQLRTLSRFSRTGGRRSAVLLPLLPSNGWRPRVMVLGGSTAETWDEAKDPPPPAIATAEVLDLGAAAPAWRSLPPMAKPRIWANSTLLPDGTVLVTGGSSLGNDHPVFQAECFDPQLERWTTLCSMRVPRLYHSTAVLLPDGRVLLAGKDGSRQPPAYRYPEYRCEVLSPPYLFAGARPTFSGAPAAASYGASITVQTPSPAAIGSVVLARPGAVTHGLNMEQRLVGLAFTRGTGTVTLQMPSSANVAPRGWYMLFMVGSADVRVPSLATFILLG